MGYSRVGEDSCHLEWQVHYQVLSGDQSQSHFCVWLILGLDSAGQSEHKALIDYGMSERWTIELFDRWVYCWLVVSQWCLIFSSDSFGVLTLAFAVQGCAVHHSQGARTLHVCARRSLALGECLISILSFSLSLSLSLSLSCSLSLSLSISYSRSGCKAIFAYVQLEWRQLPIIVRCVVALNGTCDLTRFVFELCYYSSLQVCIEFQILFVYVRTLIRIICVFFAH